MRRALVVTLEDDLHPSRVNGLFAAIRLLPGVAVIATLDSMTRETLDLLLMQPEPAVQKPSKRKRHQADLFGEGVA